MALGQALGHRLTSPVTQCPRLSTRPSSAARRLVTTGALSVRPYTVRRGDTLESIAKKRELDVIELQKLNHDVSPEALMEGQTLILPAHKLSARDKEILAGIGPWSYRTYPVRAGETLDDIISKRNITRLEMEGINPSVDLDNLEPNQVIKLPANKFTVREKEMLSNVVPAEFFEAAKSPWVSGVLGLGLLISLVYIWRIKSDDD